MKIIIYNHFPVPTIYIYREINIISIINIAVIIVITCNYIVQIYIKYKKTFFSQCNRCIFPKEKDSVILYPVNDLFIILLIAK